MISRFTTGAMILYLSIGSAESQHALRVLNISVGRLDLDDIYGGL